jgi:hypothetical protein
MLGKTRNSFHIVTKLLYIGTLLCSTSRRRTHRPPNQPAIQHLTQYTVHQCFWLLDNVLPHGKPSHCLSKTLSLSLFVQVHHTHYHHHQQQQDHTTTNHQKNWIRKSGSFLQSSPKNWKRIVLFLCLECPSLPPMCIISLSLSSFRAGPKMCPLLLGEHPCYSWLKLSNIPAPNEGASTRERERKFKKFKKSCTKTHTTEPFGTNFLFFVVVVAVVGIPTLQTSKKEKQ